MDEPTIATANAAGASVDRVNGASHSASPALRLLSEHGRLIRRRPAVLAAGIAARLHLLRGHALWPTPQAPMFGIEPGAPRSASWMRAALEPADQGRANGIGAALRAGLGAATWQGLRAGGFLTGAPPAWLLSLCAEVLGRDVSRSSLTLFSRSGASLSKAICFLFERGAPQPSLVVIAMADPSQSGRLAAEYDAVESLARALADDPEAAGALPLEPLFRGAVGDEYVVVVPPDPMAAAIGREDRTVALDWLLRLQSATGSEPRAWTAADDDRLLAELVEAWDALRPVSVAAVRDRVAAELAALRGSSVPRCSVHGDFWHGNMAVADGRLRVYDWEWASADGLPFLDLWTYEFGLMLVPPPGGTQPGDLAAAVDTVAAELTRREIDARFALATLAPALARLAIRMRRTTGRPGPAEGALLGLMEDAERVLVQA